ncbi:TetR family transcriptional regulator [Pedomonas sp.]|uniref:TetR family transcriptional regulator n=1 Tax=Pedomonas sp. TaxID=2976421 RepID=UPI002F3FB060
MIDRSGQTVSRDAMIEAALRVAREVGIGGLNGRLVAEEAGAHPSAINYRFASMDGLRRALHETLSKRSAQWRAAQLASLTAERCEAMTAGGAIAGCIAGLAADPTRRALMLQELREIHAYQICDLGTLPQQEWADNEAFYQSLLTRFPETEHLTEVWLLFAEGACSHALVDPDLCYRTAWLASLSHRVEERLSRRTVVRTPFAAPTPSAAEDDPKWPEGKTRLVEATLRIIGRRGINQVTHRRVAEEAGLSLASTTYFFSSKEELIRTAFRYLYRQTYYSSAEDAKHSGPHFTDALLTPEGQLRWEAGAHRALFFTAARDPAFHTYLHQLHNRGYSSARWLHSRGATRIDRLDGIIWSLLAGGILQRVLLLPPEQRRPYVDSVSERMFQLLFGDKDAVVRAGSGQLD